jgi:16S rRNA processing protein RimM
MMRPQPEYLIIGEVLAPWGVAGEAKVEIITDFPERFASLEQVYLGDELTPYKLERSRLYRQFVLLKFAGVDSPEAVKKLAGAAVRIPLAQAVALQPGEYYEHQIIGLEVVTEEGQSLGRVSEVLYTGGNEVYVVQGGEREVLIPAIKSVVSEISLEKGRITIRLMEGLL